MLDLFRLSRVQGWDGPWKLAAAEAAFRLFCRHRQGSKPNILLYCVRRGGSTWLMNTIAAHPGVRCEGRTFMTALYTRWRRDIPNLAVAAGCSENSESMSFVSMIHFEGRDEERFRAFAARVISGERTVYPMLRFWEPYFHRVTDRVVYKMTTTTAMIEWFDRQFSVATVVLLRHPIPTALSVMQKDWRPQCNEFLSHRWYRDTQLTKAQYRLAQRIMAEGDEIEKHVLDWTLKMLIPLRALRSGRHPDWTVVTYEQAVVQPDLVVQHLSDELDLHDVGAMRREARRPSRNVSETTSGRIHDASYVLSRWRKQVTETKERELMGILEAFELDAYGVGSDLPDGRWWVSGEACSAPVVVKPSA